VQAFYGVTIRARVDGELQQVYFQEGQSVEKGDLIAQIDPRPYQAQLDQARAKKAQDEAQLASARLMLQRDSQLINSKVLDQQTYDTQKYATDQLQALVQADQGAIDNAQTQLDYTRLVAPIYGRVGIRLVDPGRPFDPRTAQPNRELAARGGGVGIEIVRAWAKFTAPHTVQAGDLTRIGPLTIRVLHPPLPDWERQRVRNEDSVVLDVRVGDVSIVVPGDIGVEGERAILPLLAPARTVILKAPHHGSATSSTPPLLDALHPAAVIFSAGRNNRFGHPAPAVVARYRDRGVPMFSTAESGAIVIDTDGHEVSIRGWADERVMTIPGGVR